MELGVGPGALWLCFYILLMMSVLTSRKSVVILCAVIARKKILFEAVQV